MARRLLWGSSVSLTPAVLLAHYAFNASETLVFVLAAAALIPLAFLIGEATEQLSFRTGPALGALTNASLGNAPELIIALFAIDDGLPHVVLGSITGSVVSTLLLVCGASMVAGGDGQLDRRSLLLQTATTLLAVALFCVPAIASFHGNPARHSLYLLTLPVAGALLGAYILIVLNNLRHGRARRRPVPDGSWPLRNAIAALTCAAAATAIVSELLVHSLQAFGRTLGLSQFIVAVVIVALVGNAAEQGGAIVIARRGDPGLGAEIAVSSATQIAVFVCPVVALLSWAFGHDLALSFQPTELAAMGGATFAVLVALSKERSSRAIGLTLLAGYALVVAVFALVGPG